MSRSALPHGYAVVQLDDTHWYPLHIVREYSGCSPDGEPYVLLFHALNENREVVPVSYARREDAIHYVQMQAQEQEQDEQMKWQGVTVKSEVYPERCCYMLTLIEEITGRSPMVERWVGIGTVSVRIDAYRCSCGTPRRSYWNYDEVMVEDALQRAAEYAYSHRCSCTATTAHEYEQLTVVNS